MWRSLVSALVWGTRGHRFKSCHADMNFLNKAFYFPSDWYIEKTSQRQRAAINTWLLILWIIPGLLIWFLLKDALWFIGFMSIYAIWTGHLGAASAETPVEPENVSLTDAP